MFPVIGRRPGSGRNACQGTGSRIARGLAVTVVGAAYALVANTPANRQDDPLAGIAVAIGAWIAVFGGVATNTFA